MGLKEDIKNKVKSILDEKFEITDISYIPKLDDSKLTFGNTGLRFKGSVLFIDMRGSTAVLNKHNKPTVAKLHMAFFHTIVKIANSLEGHVRSFNGDSRIGIDHGEILCTKVGVGGEHNRDLFWIGNSVNKSTVLGDQSKNPNHLSISSYVYSNLLDWAKFGKSKDFLGNEIDVDIWTRGTFEYNGKIENYYYTSWYWTI